MIIYLGTYNKTEKYKRMFGEEKCERFDTILWMRVIAMPTLICHGSRTCASLREILSCFKSSASRWSHIFCGIRGQRVPPFVIKVAKSSTSPLLRHSSRSCLLSAGSTYRWANVESRVTFCTRSVITSIVFHVLQCWNHVRDVHALRASCGNLFYADTTIFATAARH